MMDYEKREQEAFMRAKTVRGTIGFLLLTALAAGFAPPAEANENARFGGGSYDGWDRYALTNSLGLGDGSISLSSVSNQVFDFKALYGALSTLTITATDPAGTMTNGGTIRLTVPAIWACRFDTGASVTCGGTASGKVGAASYADGGRTLSIPVTTSFGAGDKLTIAGLRLTDLWFVSPDTKQLELDVDGDGTRDLHDLYSLTVRVVWSGGAYDGWDHDAMAESKELAPAGNGTVLIVR